MRISDQEASRLRVLKAIRRAEPVARTELVPLTGLPAWAISEIVGDLLARNLLIEEKPTASGRGRPRVQLRLNPEAAHVVAAFLLHDGTLAVQIANLRGDKLSERSFPVDRTQELAALAQTIAANIDETIRAGHVAKGAIHSVGLGLPAVIDGAGGVLHWLPPLPARPTRFADLISGHLGLPVFLDNTANILTRSEHWFGEDRQVDDFTLIFVGLGMAAGQYVDGLLRNGDHGINSEIGHVKIGLGEGPTCLCGAKGCLTTYASIGGIAARIAERRGQTTAPERSLEAFRSHAREARAGDVAARETFELAGKALGLAVANYVNLWDPSRILIRALDEGFRELVEPSFRAALEANTLPPLRGLAPVGFQAITAAAFPRGAAALVLERLYRNPAARGRSPSGLSPAAATTARTRGANG